MQNTKIYRTLAKRILSQKRFNHTQNVKNMAVRLAKTHHTDTKSAEVAAYLHDICKELPKDKMLQILEKYDRIDAIKDKPVSIWHSKVAAVYAQNEIGIENADILSAIECHSSAKADMSLLDKIIFLADMVSEERDYKEVLYLRKLCFVDINTAMLEALELNLQWLQSENKKIDPDSINALEYFKSEKRSTIERR